jgi:hypothetical protein
MRKLLGYLGALAAMIFTGSGVKGSQEKAAGIPMPAPNFGTSKSRLKRKKSGSLEAKERKHRKARRRLTNASRRANRQYAKAA